MHLVVLYIFIQTLVDFPLAVYDYYQGTDLLYLPVKKVILGVSSILFILYYGIRKSKQRISEIFPLRSFNPLLLIFVVPFLFAAQIILNDVNIWVDKVLPPPTWFWELFNSIFESDYGWFGAFVKVAVIAPIVEESIFRGVIIRGFLRNYPKWLAVLLSALLFALFHLNPWQFPATFMLGLLLGWLMVRTNNILACIFGHAANNFLVLATVTLWPGFNPSAIIQQKWVLVTLCFVVMAISVFVIILLSRRKKWIPAKSEIHF